MKKSLDRSRYGTFIYERDVLNKNIVRGMAESGLIIGIYLLLKIIWAWTVGFAFKGLFIEGWIPDFSIMVMPLLVRRNGILVGFCAAVACSIISLLIDNSSASTILAINPISLILDYGVSGPLGLVIAWLCSFWIKQNNFVRWTVFATTLAFAGFLGSFLSGGLYYASFAPIGWGAWMYSGIYNVSASSVGYVFFWLVFLSGKKFLYRLDYYDAFEKKLQQNQKGKKLTTL